MRAQFFIFLLTSFIYTSFTQNPSLLCGNGRIDVGEECDPSAPSTSSECCTAFCRYSPVSQFCFNGSGVCRSGKCVTRASECAALDNTTLQFSSPQSGVTAISGPWDSCVIASSQGGRGVSISALSKQNKTAGTSVLNELLPPHLAAQSTCSQVCQGQAVGGSSEKICADFHSFANLDPSAADYLSCLVDNTADTNFGLLAQTSNYSTDYAKVLTPGVCITGVCRADICGSTRCNNNGRCVLSQSTVQAMNASLGVETSQKTTSSPLSIITCKCNSEWGGDQCDVPAAEIPGTSDSSNSDDCGPYADQRMQEIVLTSVLCTAAGCIIIFILIVFLTRYLSNKKDDDEETKPGAPGPNPESKRKSIFEAVEIEPESPPFKELSELPQITPFDGLLVGEDVLFEERSSSTSDSDFGSQHSASPRSQNTILESPADIVPPELTRDAPIPVPLIISTTELSATSDSSNAILPSAQNVLLPANYLRAAHAYNARLVDEINLFAGDILYLIKAYDDGWAKAYNLRSGREGIFPLSFAKRIVVKDQTESLTSFAKGGVYAGGVEDSIIEEEDEDESTP